MDVDAGERRAGNGGRGSHAPQRRNAGIAGTDRSPVMKARSELYAIREPEAPAQRKIPDRPICQHEAPAEPRALERPWPRQHEWRNLVRRLAKNPVAGPRIPEMP